MTARRRLPRRRSARLTIVSGGQTGVDRAALDVALAMGVARGGWCPRGRRAEDGPIAAAYPLVETPRPAYLQRTAWNVRDSDATLVLARGAPSGGTRATIRLAARHGRPCRVVDPRRASPGGLAAWLCRRRVRVLNVAGPRESESPGIHGAASHVLERLMLALQPHRNRH